MDDFRSSPEGALLRELARLHRADEMPAKLAEQVSMRIAALPRAAAASRSSRGRQRVLRGARWAAPPLVAAAVTLLSIGAWKQRSVPVEPPQQAEGDQTAGMEVVTGGAVPGSLRWRVSGAECEYVFLLERAVDSAPIEVRWRRCELPAALRRSVSQELSPIAGAPTVALSVTGQWSASGQFEAEALTVE